MATKASLSGKTPKFSVFGHTVVIPTGEQARKLFFFSRTLDNGEGFQILTGHAPRIEEVMENRPANQKRFALFIRRTHSLLHRDRLEKLIPELFSDLNTHMNSWPKNDQVDPFANSFGLMFHMTMRSQCAREFADDLSTLHGMGELLRFWNSEQEFSFNNAFTSWAPGSVVQKRKKAIGDLYGILTDIIKKRGDEGRCENDAFQFMLDQGDTIDDIFPYMLWIVFIGTAPSWVVSYFWPLFVLRKFIFSSAIVANWVLMFLKTHPEWDTKVRNELQSLCGEHCPDLALPAHVRFAQIPLDAWEGSTPVMEAVITETVRIVSTEPAFRRNIGGDVELNGLKVERGEFLMYPFGIEQMNKDNYPNPSTWNPARWADPAKFEHDRSQGKFLGWGIGMHPCLGMRIAKLYIKFTVALFIHNFEYSRVDRSGKVYHDVPVPNLSDTHCLLPKGKGHFLHIKRKSES
ncbi:hypothetical protein SERLA73DRAFT_75339 [Serpula lacrymans var. lacrymans S7.3]|uniref:Cytochrome P450 n=1 Tax=Serpula lacrymans var. lacrymans (strain S7.3) TaxID=936435 RepID=F8Q3B8_SERL3|nr:hypothetical protein SERLA73DRAFT_75339 [Serpula lacrymans var. lacrymans S7.3]